MALYCGIDLHSRDSWLAILNEELEVVGETKVGNDLEAIIRVLEPHREALEGVAVESTFNWRNLSTTVRHVQATFTEHSRAKRPRFRGCLLG